MVLFLADEDFNGRIVRGLQRRKSDLDLIRAQDVGLLGVDDDGLLAWADENGRLLLTHDARTMPNHVLDRLATGMHLPGVFIVDDLASIGLCVEDILLVAEAAIRVSGKTGYAICLSNSSSGVAVNQQVVSP